MDAELRDRLIAAFRWIDPGPHVSHLVSDASGWWRDPVVLAGIGPALASLVDVRPTVVVAPEVTGFLVGPLVATAVGAGFVEAYKDDREQAIADPVAWADTGADYRGRRMRIGVRARHVRPGDRVLLVDDWVATGAQLLALAELAASRGAVVVGTVAVVDDTTPDVRTRLRLRALLSSRDLPSDG